MDGREWYGAEEAANILGCAQSTVWRRGRDGVIRTRRSPGGGVIEYAADDVNKAAALVAINGTSRGASSLWIK